MNATFTITVAWWAYAVFCAAVFTLIAAGYIIGRLDRADARQARRINLEYAPTLNRWRALDASPARGGSRWPVNTREPGWALTLAAWGQAHQRAYPRPPALTAEPDPRTAVVVGHAEVVGVEPLDFAEQISAGNVAVGGPTRWAADVEETGWIPAVTA